ncbi:MAG: NAD kinase [Pseudomonadota bacterium]|nr:NAD kinase [Pseudomonadota bacterium]
MRFNKISIASDNHANAKDAASTLRSRYQTVSPDEADVIVALGGDGFMLSTIHKYMKVGTPIFGMNLGSVGFLMNKFDSEQLPRRLEESKSIDLKPLSMTADTADGSNYTALAINEVSLLRATHYASKIRILVDGIVRLEELICDGIMISTAAGSTAYNLSAHGPIIPLGAELLALTPISAFRPRRWRGALLPQNSIIRFEMIDPKLRSVSAVADFTEIRDVVCVEVTGETETSSRLLFDSEHNLEERILKEQFLP